MAWHLNGNGLSFLSAAEQAFVLGLAAPTECFPFRQRVTSGSLWSSLPESDGEIWMTLPGPEDHMVAWWLDDAPMTARPPVALLSTLPARALTVQPTTPPSSDLSDAGLVTVTASADGVVSWGDIIVQSLQRSARAECGYTPTRDDVIVALRDMLLADD